MAVLLFLSGAMYAAANYVVESRNKAALEEPEKEIVMPVPPVSETVVEVPKYPAPEYDFVPDEIVVEISGLEKEYTIAVVNDVHMITDHEAGDVLEENLEAVADRYENLAITKDGVHAEELWPEIIKYLNFHDFDAIVFAGDLVDYGSHSNYRMLNGGLNQLKYPREKMMYIRSDHDYGGWYGGSVFTDADGFEMQSKILDGDATKKAIYFDEFSIVGINKSYRSFSEGTCEFLNEELDGDKPILMVTHVPFYSNVDESLEELSMEVRNRIYYWSEDGTSYVPEGMTKEIIDKMYAEDSNVAEIIAAHVHAKWDGYVTENLKQHIFAPTFDGTIGIIHVTGEQNENVKESVNEVVEKK